MLYDYITYFMQSNKFCGRSIKINVECEGDKKIVICGHICNKPKFKVNDLVPCNFSKNNDRSDCPFYFGKEIIPYKEYEINSQLKAWCMNANILGINKNFAFYVYLLKESTLPNKYLCDEVIQSPYFTFVSARRTHLTVTPPSSSNTTNDLPQFSPVVPKLEDTSTDLLIPLKNLTYNDKSDSDPTIFKFDYLMPHIFDDDDNPKDLKVDSDIEQSKKEKVIETSLHSSEAVEEVLKDLHTSTPNTIVKVNTKKGQVEMRLIDKERQEFTYLGKELHESYHVEEEHILLDRYGNKYKLDLLYKHT